MPPNIDRTNQEVAKVITLKNKIIDTILNQVDYSPIDIESWPDEITPDTKSQILNSYMQRIFIDGKETFATFEEIGSNIFPHSSEINTTLVKEIISKVSQSMYFKLIMEKFSVNDPFIQSLRLPDETIEECAKRLTSEYYQMRIQRIHKMRPLKERLNNPDVDVVRRIKSSYTSGRIIWTLEKFNYLKKLVESTKWPEGTHRVGKPDWVEIANLFSKQIELINQENLPKKLKDAWIDYQNNPPTITEAYVAEVLAQES